jgi:VWFA-related protein
VRRILTSIALAFAAGRAQVPPDDVPVFRTHSQLVQVNVIVRDKKGPVAGLTKDDFVITDRGKAQTIGLFALDDAREKGKAVVPLPQNTFSNRQRISARGSAGVTIIVLDALNTLYYSIDPSISVAVTPAALHTENHGMSLARRHLTRYFEADLPPEERVAMYSLDRGLSVLCDFTSDREQLRKALAAYQQRPLTDSETAEPAASQLPSTSDFNAAVDEGNRNVAGVANGNRASLTLAALAAIAHHVADIPGRKNLIWLTASLPFSARAAARALNGASIAIYPVDVRGLATSFNPHFSLPGLDAMQELADATGGLPFFNTNDLSGAVRTALEDAAMTYTLGFYVDADSLDGEFHQLKVHVKRAGLDVRHPGGYFALPESRAPAARNQASIRTAMLSPLESSVIPLLVRVTRVNEPRPNSLGIVASIGLDELHLAERADLRSGAVDVYIVQHDKAGNVLDRTHRQITLRLTKAQYAAYQKSGVLFRARVEPKDGLATLRVLAGDPSDARVGSVIIPLASVQ